MKTFLQTAYFVFQIRICYVNMMPKYRFALNEYFQMEVFKKTWMKVIYLFGIFGDYQASNGL